MTNRMTDDLIEMIVRELKIDRSRVSPDTPLFENGLELDSFAVVELISMIEEQFGLQFSDDDFRPENFTNIKTLSGVLTRYQVA